MPGRVPVDEVRVLPGPRAELARYAAETYLEKTALYVQAVRLSKVEYRDEI